jgi:hypothetical protein
VCVRVCGIEPRVLEASRETLAGLMIASV